MASSSVLAATTSFFIFVQHGSHGMLRDFDPLKSELKRKFDDRCLIMKRFLLEEEENHTKHDNNNNNSTNSPKPKVIQKLSKLLTTSNKKSSSESLYRGKKKQMLVDILTSSLAQQQQENPRRANAESNQMITFKVFGSAVNEGLGTDQGTMKCIDKAFPELQAELQKENKHNNKVYFSTCAHSFGGLLMREMLKRLFTSSSCSSSSSLQQQQVTPVQFVTIASPHCGVNSIEYSLLRFGGRLLGKIYSSTYAELFVDSPLLKRMAGIVNDGDDNQQPTSISSLSTTTTEKNSSCGYLDALTRFKDHLFVAAVSNDYLVRFETATMIPISILDELASSSSSSSSSSSQQQQDDARQTKEKFPKRVMMSTQKQSTHVGEMIQVFSSSHHHRQDEHNSPNDSTSSSTSDTAQKTSTHTTVLAKLNCESDCRTMSSSSCVATTITDQKFQQMTVNNDPVGLQISSSLRSALIENTQNHSYRVMPVFIPSSQSSSSDVDDNNKNTNKPIIPLSSFISPETFSIAHDALLRKGVSCDVLPDVVEAVAEEMIDELFCQYLEDYFSQDEE